MRQGVLWLASLLVLAGIFWIVRAVERAPARESATAGTGVEPHAEATDTELAEPEFLAPDAEADLDEASVAPAERPWRTASASSARARTVAHLRARAGRAFLFVEASGDLEAWVGHGPPVAGVAVLADGRFVAESDADGLALARFAQRPEKIEFALAGWSVHDERRDTGVTVVAVLRE